MAKRAVEDALSAHNSIVALSLLRLVRAEQLMIEAMSGPFPDMADKAQEIIKGYVFPGLELGLYVGGELIADTCVKVFQASGEKLLEQTPDYDWSFNEFLVLPYAVESGLLYAAQMIVAKSYSLKALQQMYLDCMLRESDSHIKYRDAADLMESKRYAYLDRQIQTTFIYLTGFANGQYGMGREEAIRILHNAPL